MADNLQDESQHLADAMEELRKNGTLSAESLARLGGNSTAAYKALDNYTKKVVGVTSAMSGMATSLAQGQGSFASMGTTIEATTKMMGNLLNAIPLVGGAAKALAEGVGEASKFVLDQLDAMARNYQTLGDASAGAADGVDGLLRQFNQMGNYSLPAFTKAIKANMTGMAAFRGSTSEGAEALSEISGALTTGQTAQKFLKLGISLDAVGDAAASYAADFGRYGILQGDTTDQVTKKTQAYIIEVDQIARLTAQSREQQQKEQQKSLADARFRAKIADMQASGQGKQAEQLTAYVNGLGGAAGDAARALVTGIPLTKEAAEANLFSGDALRQNTQDIIAGSKDAVQATADTQKALGQGFERFGTQIMYSGNTFGGVAIQAADALQIQRRAAEITAKTGLSQVDAMTQAQTEQMNATEKTTEEFTDAQLAVANSSKNLQKLGFSLAKDALPAVDAFAKGLNKVTDFIDKHFGSGTPSSKPGVGDNKPGTGGRGPVDMHKSVFGNAGGAAGNLLDLIGKGESGGNYDQLVGGKTADLTNMTIQQVLDMQKTMTKTNGFISTAVGKYQMINSTLLAEAKNAGLDLNTTKFDKATQDLLANQLVDQAGYGKKDTATVMKNLASTWAALPKDMSGRGAYDRYNNNMANIKPDELIAAITKPKDREIAKLTDKSNANITAPTSGYQSQTASVKPPTETVANAPPPPPPTNPNFADGSGAELLCRISDQLEILNYTNQRIAESTNKVAKNTAA